MTPVRGNEGSRTARAAFFTTYLLALVVILLDLFVWRAN